MSFVCIFVLSFLITSYSSQDVTSTQTSSTSILGFTSVPSQTPGFLIGSSRPVDGIQVSQPVDLNNCGRALGLTFSLTVEQSTSIAVSIGAEVDGAATGNFEIDNLLKAEIETSLATHFGLTVGQERITTHEISYPVSENEFIKLEIIWIEIGERGEIGVGDRLIPYFVRTGIRFGGINPIAQVCPTFTPPPTLDASITPAGSSGFVARVIKWSSNVRSGPGTPFPIVQGVNPYEEFEVVAWHSAGGYIWYEIKLPNGDTAWIYSENVLILPNATGMPTASIVPRPPSLTTSTPTLAPSQLPPLPPQPPPPVTSIGPGPTAVILTPQPPPTSNVDSDGDGIPDHADACPYQAPEPGRNPNIPGCPDTDGDTIADIVDDCPTVWGRLPNGCEP
jgi:hypothetical protein